MHADLIRIKLRVFIYEEDCFRLKTGHRKEVQGEPLSIEGVILKDGGGEGYFRSNISRNKNVLPCYYWDT